MNNRVSLYWDFENVRVPDQAECLIDFAQSRGYVVTNKVYSHWSRETSKSKYVLDRCGFERIHVWEKGRNSADRKLKSDCLAELYSSWSSDIIIIVSGDGGFASLVRKLQRRRKQVIVFGPPGGTSSKLIYLADDFYFAEDLCWLVG
ncbi:MAG TPA: hypothetical protein DCE56_21765 [Cyanobacteria bacterium UBA8553]|nr:hypothetical protein [Cyanobacteria bacterium UBA8553]